MRKLKISSRTTVMLFTLVATLMSGFAYGDILFEDNFDSGSMSPEWVSVDPTQWVEDFWLHTQSTWSRRDSGAVVHDGDPGWTDYTISLKVDPIFNGWDWEWADVFFRTRDTRTRDTEDNYGVNGFGYRFSIMGPENFTGPRLEIVRYWLVAGEHQFTVIASISYPVPSGPMDVVIILEGAHIQVLIDGQLAINIIDPDPHLYGGIGIGAIWEAEAIFDDVIVDSSTALFTVSTSLTCLPSSGVVPFDTKISVALTNLVPDQSRTIAGHIDATIANGLSFPDWRAGYAIVSGGDSFITSWNQTIPACGSLIGTNVFSLVAEDVTPAPYNQPPYPPAGNTDTDTCTVIGLTEPTELVLWNRLGSQGEVENSEAGQNGTFNGGGFMAGMFGNAFVADYSQNGLVSFPKEVLPIEEGCIEFWGKLIGLPLNMGYSGARPGLVSISDGISGDWVISFTGNDGVGNGGLNGKVGRLFATGSGRYGAWTYEQVLGSGQVEEWHHYALVWNSDGIAGVDDGTREVAVFLDGELESGRWETIGDAVFLPLGDCELMLLTNQGMTQGGSAIDNLIIWDYPKTDFSDRFIEEPIAR